MALRSHISDLDSRPKPGRSSRHPGRKLWSLSALFLLVIALPLLPCWAAQGPTSDDCLACHSDKSMTTKRGGRTVSLFVDQKKFAGSIHGSLQCTSCHADLDGKELPHSTPLAKVNCGSCHSEEAQLLAKSMHGKAAGRGDALAPRCVSCHGNHDILPVKDPRSSVAAMKVPFVCGQCHREGTPVQTTPQHPGTRHSGELFREHSRRGIAEEGPDRGGQLRLVPHGALDPAAHRSQLVDQPAQHRHHLHQVPCQHRTGTPQDDSR